MKLIWVVSTFLAMAAQGGESVPDFEVRVLRDQDKAGRWVLQATPPSRHHFNLKAPAQAQMEPLKVSFAPLVQKPLRLDFVSSDAKLSEGQSVRVTAFLCDDAKTYCVKKVRHLELRAAAAATQGPGRIHPQGKRDAQGFFKDPEAALSEARRRGLPLLVEFYGIWCPPCNLYSERVFPSPEFRRLKKRSVLLRLDADREESFEWKSRFKVGGYPTWIVASAGANASFPIEMGRMVGFYPPKEFEARTQAILAGGVDDRVSRSRQQLLEALKDSIRIAIEKKEIDAAMKFLHEAALLDPKDPDLGLYRVQAKVLASEPLSSSDLAVLSSLLDLKHAISADQALRAAYLVLDSSDRFPKEVVLNTSGFLDVLQKNLDPKTFFVPGTECNAADLEMLRSERAKILGDESQRVFHRRAAIDAYRKMLAKGSPESRGLNLELAALLSAEGRYDEAARIYERFIRRFPDEFTFYFAASRMYLEKKDLAQARMLAEKAVRHAYGDNLIRSMDRLIQVMAAQGEGASALLRGEAFLSTLKVHPELKVRTGRYVAALKKTLYSIQTPASQEKQ